MRQAYPSPLDLFRDQAAQLAERVVGRIALSQAQPDEYQQLAPYLDRFFDALRSRRTRARRAQIGERR
jgi:hypothetical protein